MKKLIISFFLVALFASGAAIKAQDKQDDRLGLPGDNLNLYAVMKLFQESKTLEDFEKSLNDPDSRINNLDLNGDNMVDYIRVVDNVYGDVHNIVLQDAINDREVQDVAVFTVQRFQNGQVQIQLTGDEELYGKDYIIEPIYSDDNQTVTPNPGYTGPVNGQDVTVVRTTRAEISMWPLIRFIYLPGYIVWHSSWRWSYYPPYWHPWKPFFWDYYWGYQHNWYNDYYMHYRRWNVHRYARWNATYFTSRRSYSPIVYSRIQTGNFRTTYSHPEQRKDGEALYIKTHPDQGRRPVINSSNYSRSNRSGQQSNSKVTSSSSRRNNKNVVSEKSKTKKKNNKKTKESDTKTKVTDTRRNQGNP